MRGSVIYQEILQEGEIRGEEKTLQRIVLGMLSEGMSIELAPDKRIKVTAIDSFHRSPSTCFIQTF